MKLMYLPRKFHQYLINYPLHSLGCNPFQLHDLLYSLASAVSWLLLFGMIEVGVIKKKHVHNELSKGILLQAFNAVKATVAPGLVLYLWVFAGASIFVGLISLPILPETRNRRPSAVQRDLGYVDDGGVAKGSAATNGHISTHI